MASSIGCRPSCYSFARTKGLREVRGERVRDPTYIRRKPLLGAGCGLRDSGMVRGAELQILFDVTRVGVEWDFGWSRESLGASFVRVMLCGGRTTVPVSFVWIT